jgi:hypothetical protein
MLDIGDVLLGGIPDMFNGVVIWGIGWHGNEMDTLQDASFFQFIPYCFALMERCVVPDNTKLLSGMFF